MTVITSRHRRSDFAIFQHPHGASSIQSNKHQNQIKPNGDTDDSRPPRGGCRGCMHTQRAAGTRRDIPCQASPPAQPVPGRQRPGRGLPHDWRPARPGLEPAGDRRRPPGRQRLHRHGGHPPLARHRVRAGHRGRRPPGHQSQPVQETALRPGEGLRARHRAVPDCLFRCGLIAQPHQVHPRAPECRQGRPECGVVWLMGGWQPRPPGRRPA